MKKEIQLNMRVSKELHEEIKREAIKKSIQKNELITVSEIIREMLEEKFIKNEK
jgi:hypothetical protein